MALKKWCFFIIPATPFLVKRVAISLFFSAGIKNREKSNGLLDCKRFVALSKANACLFLCKASVFSCCGNKK